MTLIATAATFVRSKPLASLCANTHVSLLSSHAQRHLEIVLFNRHDGGSSGAIWKALNNSGLNATSLSLESAANKVDEEASMRAQR